LWVDLNHNEWRLIEVVLEVVRVRIERWQQAGECGEEIELLRVKKQNADRLSILYFCRTTCEMSHFLPKENGLPLKQ
jgi:hypothetical protein